MFVLQIFLTIIYNKYIIKILYQSNGSKQKIFFNTFILSYNFNDIFRIEIILIISLILQSYIINNKINIEMKNA